jgi:hypothetical protein
VEPSPATDEGTAPMTAAQQNELKTQLHNERILHAQLIRQLRNLNPQSREAQEHRETLQDSATMIRCLESFLD